MWYIVDWFLCIFWIVINNVTIVVICVPSQESTAQESTKSFIESTKEEDASSKKRFDVTSLVRELYPCFTGAVLIFLSPFALFHLDIKQRGTGLLLRLLKTPLKASVSSKSQFTGLLKPKQLRQNLSQKSLALQRVNISKILRDIVQIKKNVLSRRDLHSMKASMLKRYLQSTWTPPVRLKENLIKEKKKAKVKRPHMETQTVRVRLQLGPLINRKIGQLARGSLLLRRLIENTKTFIQGSRARPPQLPNICGRRKKRSWWRSCVRGWKSQSSKRRGSSTKMKCMRPSKIPPQAEAQMDQVAAEQTQKMSNLDQTERAIQRLVPRHCSRHQIIRYRKWFSRAQLFATKTRLPNARSWETNSWTSGTRWAAPSLWERLTGVKMLLRVVYQTEDKRSRLYQTNSRLLPIQPRTFGLTRWVKIRAFRLVQLNIYKWTLKTYCQSWAT